MDNITQKLKMTGMKTLQGEPIPDKEPSEELVKEYELKQKLKDGGFPLKGTWPTVQSELMGWDEDYFIPTLSELIGACGDNIYGIFRDEPGIWAAHSESMNPEMPAIAEYIGRGKTPEEAVTNLWLKLNNN